MLDSLISGMFALGSNALNRTYAEQEAQRERNFNAGEAVLNRAFQRQERLAAQEFDLDMWNLNNEYNSLENQLARARAAGVNPNAILGGDYKSATSSPVSTTPMSGAQASSNIAGALGSSMIGNAPSLLNSVGDFVKNMVDSKVAIRQVALNEKMIDSNIDHNLASIQKLCSDAGVNNASAEQIKKATSWMDKRNDVEIQEIAARVTNWYNQNNKILQEIKNLEANEKLTYTQIDNTSASTDNIKANTDYIESQKNYQDTLNTYADRQQSAFTTQAEADAAIATLKAELAKEIGVPLDSPEFAFNWKLAINGKFEEYCDKVIIPEDRATWKPRDYSVDNKFGTAINTEYFWHFDPRKGIVNPRVNDTTDLKEYWSDYYETMSKVDAIKAKYEKKYLKK